MPKISSKFIQVHIAKYSEELSEYEYLILKRSENVIPYPCLWQVVTGNIEAEETSIKTAIREVYEETRLKPKKVWTLPYITTFFDAHKDIIYMSPVFGISVYTKNVILSPEHSEYKWLKYEDCIEKLELLSHREATTVFRDCILDEKNNMIFEFSKDFI